MSGSTSSSAKVVSSHTDTQNGESWNNSSVVGTVPTSANGGTATIEVQRIEKGASATNDVAGLLGVIDLLSGATGTLLSATSGGVILDSGGTITSVSVYSSAALLVANGGTATNVSVASGGGVVVGDVGSVTNSPIINGYITSKGVNLTGTGVVSGGTFAAGSIESVGSGGTDISSLMQGTQYVSAGAITIDDTVNSGGVQNLLSGAVTTSTTVGSGGTTVASSGAVVSSTTVSGGTVQVLGGAKVLGGVVEAGGELVVSSGAIASGVTVSSGGTEIVLSGGTVSGGSVISGGTEVVSSGATSLNVTIGSGGSLIVAAGSVLSGTVVSQGAVIDVDTLSYVSGGTVHLSGNTLTVTEGGSTWTTVLSGTYNSTDYFVLGEDDDGSTVLTFVCFCAGTLIRTEYGERLVEELKIGDTVMTYVDGEEVASRLTWVGRRTMSVRPELPIDMAGYPVRILKDALAPNVPERDLLITAEHCLYLDGKFIPARMLVNGRSIFYDATMTHYDYFHVETERHSILWSNGALSESYLDTGNRRDFGQQGSIVRLVNRNALDWTMDAAAPLSISRNVVEPIYRQLEARATRMRVEAQYEPSPITNDPDLHLLTSKGQRLNVIRKMDDGQVFFMVPSNVDEVRIVSRASRPSDVVGPYVDDRRELGVLISQLTQWCEGEQIAITSHLEQEKLSGWAGLESPEMRWTTGDARLKLPNTSGVVSSLLSLRILRAGPYVLAEESKQSAVS